MHRRYVLPLPAVIALAALPSLSQSQPLALRLVRRTGWEELMGRNQCVISDLYKSEPSFPQADLGTKLGTALELAYRNNLSDISAIPGGEYKGSVRTGGSLGWRIELQGVADDRSNIQLHIGNTPNNTRGCILPGTGSGNDLSCRVTNSAAAIDKLKQLYGSNIARPVILRIQPVPTKTRIEVAASEYVRGTNVALRGPPNANYGNDVLLNGPPYTERLNAAEFEFRAEAGGSYRLYAEYAAAAARPVRIFINGSLAFQNALGAVTGCWTINCQREFDQGVVMLRQGGNVMRVERASYFPHIRSFTFEPSQ